MATTHQNQDAQERLSKFSCKICLDIPNEPVTTSCGHLYCWTCIYNWGKSKGMKTSCPYCNNGIDINKLQPIYTGDERKPDSASQDIPRRPEQPRQENPHHAQENNANGAGRFGNTQIHFGFMPGLFGLFSSGLGFSMNFGGGNNNNSNNNNYGGGGAYAHNNAYQQRPQAHQNRAWIMMMLPLFLFLFQFMFSLSSWFYTESPYHSQKSFKSQSGAGQSYYTNPTRRSVPVEEPWYNTDALLTVCLVIITSCIAYFVKRFQVPLRAHTA